MNKIFQLLEIAGQLLKRIIRGKDIPPSEATKLADQVRESIAMVDKGTSKIDDQIKQLRQIQDQIDAYEAGSPLAGVKVAGQESIEELLTQISKDTGATFDEIKDALRTEVNLGYAADDPKRLAILDDEGLREYIQVQYLMGNKDDITRTVLDAIGPRKNKADEYKDIFSGNKPKKNLGLTDDEIRFLSMDDATYKDLGKTDVGIPKPKGIQTEIDEAMKQLDIQQDKLRQVEEKMADPKNFDKMTQPGGIAKLMEEVDKDNILDLEEFRRRRAKDPVDDDGFAMGGRIGANAGIFVGKKVMDMMKKFGMKAPDKVADKQQIKNVIEDPNTDLEYRKTIKDEEGMITRQGTKPGQPTIEDIRDMIQNDPRYDKLTRAEMDKVVIKETIRADLAYNMGLSRAEARAIPDQTLEEMYRQGYQNKYGLANGGGVGTLFKRKK
tara:strand:- start:3621 stop:4937 length:1317 start_codon:yes stop_codon:yes gene_type:complete